MFVWELEGTLPYFHTGFRIERYNEQVLVTELIDSKPTVIVFHYFRIAALCEIDSAITHSNGTVHDRSVSVGPADRTGVPVYGKEIITYDNFSEVTFQYFACVTRFALKILFVK